MGYPSYISSVMVVVVEEGVDGEWRLMVEARIDNGKSD